MFTSSVFTYHLYDMVFLLLSYCPRPQLQSHLAKCCTDQFPTLAFQCTWFSLVWSEYHRSHFVLSRPKFTLALAFNSSVPVHTGPVQLHDLDLHLLASALCLFLECQLLSSAPLHLHHCFSCLIQRLSRPCNYMSTAPAQHALLYTEGMSTFRIRFWSVMKTPCGIYFTGIIWSTHTPMKFLLPYFHNVDKFPWSLRPIFSSSRKM